MNRRSPQARATPGRSPTAGRRFARSVSATNAGYGTVVPSARAALNDALRGVMLQGSGLAPLLPEVAVLAVWETISFLLALKFFRWQ